MARSAKFRRQVVSGYGTIILLLAVPAAIAIGNAYYAAQMRNRTNIELIERLQLGEEVSRTEAALTTAAWTYQAETISQRRQAFVTAHGALGATNGDEDVSSTERILLTAGDYLASLDALLAAQTAGPQGRVQEVFTARVVPNRNALIGAIEAYVAEQQGMVERVRRRANNAFVLMLVVPGAAFVVAIAASLWFARRSVRELRLMYEREQRAKSRARQAVTDREELQRVLAHDLRSPLNAIAMQAGVIRMSSDLDQAHEQAHSIEMATRQISQLLQTLLDAGRIQDGRFSIEPRPMDAAPVLREAATLYQAQAGNRSLKLDLPAEPVELMVMAERPRLVQALSNLLGNALRYTPEGGTIILGARLKGDFLTITVSDTGPGIDKEHLPRLFDRYYTTANGTEEGTGLGLYITRSIVEAHGGRIWVESVPGKGAAFHFTMPLAEGRTG